MPKRYSYFDALRIIAIALVLLNHLPANRMFMYESGVTETFALIFSSLVRINVPMFAMISGALLLGRDETYKQLWDKRISRFLLVIVLFTTLLYFNFWWLRNRTFSVSELFYGIFAGNLKDFTSYWFLYAYLGFLLLLPFLRHIAKTMTRGDFIMLLGLNVLFQTLIPIVNLILRLNGLQTITISQSISTALYTTVLVFFPLIGYWIDKNIDVFRITRKQWTLLAAAAIIGTTLTSTFTFVEGKHFGFSQHYINLFNVVNVIVIFLAFKRLFNTSFAEKHLRSAKWLSVIASVSFGIYLLDPSFKLMVYEPLKAATWHTLHAFWFSMLCCTLSFICCGTVTYHLKRVPFLKKLI